jgi:cyclopropane-fatty-acyl-phospholipid synthase
VEKRAGLVQRLARRAVLSRLRGLRCGAITLVDGEDRFDFGDAGEGGLPRVTLTVGNWAAYVDVALGGALGAGEAYVRGHWQCDDLTALVRILVRNEQVLYGLGRGVGRLMAPLHKLIHRWRRNTPGGSRRNIAAHYDLGNSLFELFLDETMMYSSAIFEQPRAGLRSASLAKLERICQKLELNPSDHVLEIGSGWGGFAIHAARHYGCRVTTTTISREQYRHARRRVEEAGLSDRVTVLCEDYRHLSGRYSKLVSIEMIEAVGHEYFDTFFRRCSEMLEPHGAMLLQAITIADQRYPKARKAVDFIQRYIFPGGCLPSVRVLTECAARRTDMRLFHMEDIGPHYAQTLRHWRARFFENLQSVRALGYSDQFIRMWDYYLCYCEGGFMERKIGTVQMLFTKPMNRQASILSPLPAARNAA